MPSHPADGGFGNDAFVGQAGNEFYRYGDDSGGRHDHRHRPRRRDGWRIKSIEPFITNVSVIDFFYGNEEWAKLRCAMANHIHRFAKVGE